MRNLLIKIYSWFNNDKFKISLLAALIFLSVFTIYVLQPIVRGDTSTYIEAMKVLKTGVAPADFIPNRIISTYLGLRSIMLINVFVNNLFVSWLILNSFLYIAMGMSFYSLLIKIVDNARTAFLGTLFLMTNYAAVIFSFNYQMDIGGWAFYVATLYFSYKYLETRCDKWLWTATLLVALGGLFKEYAFLAYTVIFGLIIFVEWRRWGEMIKKIFLTGLLAFIPMLIINLYAFFKYHYTYLNWFIPATQLYPELNRPIEYLKSFGSLYTFGWFLFLGGLYLFLKRFKETLRDQKLLFIWLVVISSLAVFVWPVVTRVLFITLPAVVLISSLFIKKFDKWWYLVVLLLIPYVLSSYFMDSFILNFINLPF